MTNVFFSVPANTVGWAEGIGQLFNVMEEATDVTARPAIEQIAHICTAIYNDAAEKLGATSMDDSPGQWLKARVCSDEELVVYR